MPEVSQFRSNWAEIKPSIIPADTGYSVTLDVQPSGSSGVVESIDSEAIATEESPISIPSHPLGVKPSGNRYTAQSNARDRAGDFQILPDEILAICLEYLESHQLRLLESTCKFLYAFCRSEDLWKALFIE
jgi:hypothetical protein